MEKYRITFTVQDYYDYIGTNPRYSIKERMLESIPDLFKKNLLTITIFILHTNNMTSKIVWFSYST